MPVDRDIDLVVSRKHTQGAGWDEERRARFVAPSRGYLDELALMSLLNERERFVEAYPSRFLTLLHDPRRLSVPDLPVSGNPIIPTGENWVAVDTCPPGSGTTP